MAKNIFNAYKSLPVRLPGTTKDKRARMIESVVEQKMKREGKVGKGNESLISEKVKRSNILKSKMKQKGVY